MQIKSLVESYHKYKRLLKPVKNEELANGKEPINVVDENAA